MHHNKANNVIIIVYVCVFNNNNIIIKLKYTIKKISLSSLNADVSHIVDIS